MTLKTNLNIDSKPRDSSVKLMINQTTRFSKPVQNNVDAADTPETIIFINSKMSQVAVFYDPHKVMCEGQEIKASSRLKPRSTVGCFVNDHHTVCARMCSWKPPNVSTDAKNPTPLSGLTVNKQVCPAFKLMQAMVGTHFDHVKYYKCSPDFLENMNNTMGHHHNLDENNS